MNQSGHLRVAALIDLPRTPLSGGHVKCWERLAAATAQGDWPLDLTVWFSGRAKDEALGPRTRIRHLPPVFSTANLKFLSYVPDHTDLSPYHPKLAKELATYDVIHTTDGFFAFARTAARVSAARGIPLVNSFHTDTPNYARIFTQQTIEKIFGTGWLGRRMIDKWRLPEREGRLMEQRLDAHLRHCCGALVTRPQDHALAENILGPTRVHHMRRGVDKDMFGPHRRDREGVERDYRIPPNHTVVLFVGRVDIGKNIYTLLSAMGKLVAEGHPLYLIVAGVGPAMDDVKNGLGAHVAAPGFIAPDELARLYASVDVLAVPSEVEVHSMVGGEALASGCPTIIADKSGVAQLFNTSAMWIVESGVAAWTHALRGFTTDADKQRAMRAAAADYRRDHLASWRDVMAEDILPVWQEAAGSTAQQRKAA